MIFDKLLPGKKGQQVEELACDYLVSQGCRLVARNFRCRSGEIDLIINDQGVLAFVEVRYRQQSSYGNGIESVNYQKRKKLLTTAEYYLLTHHLTDKIPCRFDIIALSKDLPLQWLKNAFSYDSIR